MNGMRSYLFCTTSKIVELARSGQISDARKLFDEIPHKDSVAWKAMLTAYSHVGLYQQSLSLFGSMRISPSKPDDFSFSGPRNGLVFNKGIFDQYKNTGTYVSGFQLAICKTLELPPATLHIIRLVS